VKALVPPFLLRHCHPRVATPREGIFTITYPLEVFVSAHLVVTAARIQIELVLIELEKPLRLVEADSFDAPIAIIFVPNSVFNCRMDLVGLTAHVEMDLILLLRRAPLLPLFNILT